MTLHIVEYNKFTQGLQDHESKCPWKGTEYLIIVQVLEGRKVSMNLHRNILTERTSTTLVKRIYLSESKPLESRIWIFIEFKRNIH